MTGTTAAVERLDALMGAAMIAHEAIFEMHRELIASERGSAEQDSLLAESALIVVGQLPSLTAATRKLCSRWSEQSLLDPDAAEATLGEISAELDRIQPSVEARLGRQRQIAGRLRGKLES